MLVLTVYINLKLMIRFPKTPQKVQKTKHYTVNTIVVGAHISSINDTQRDVCDQDILLEELK